jgi:hypothetical protein
MAQAYAVFGHGRFIWMLQMTVTVVLLGSGFSAVASLSNIDLTTFAGCAYVWSLELKVILHRLKETGNRLLCVTHRLDNVCGLHPADVREGCAVRVKLNLSILMCNFFCITVVLVVDRVDGVRQCL